MKQAYKQSRRNMTQKGLLSLAGAALTPSVAGAEAIRPKQDGETKVVAFMGGDYGHNRITYEMRIRELFSPKKDWRIIFVQGSGFFTPELISDADLLILSRHSRPDDIAFRPDGLVEEARTGPLLWRDENIRAIVDNVINRGMGFLALHNTIASKRTEIENLLDIAPIPHRQVQPLWIHDLNQNHPITHGIGKFLINIDEQFCVIIKSPDTVSLFETTALHDKRQGTGGWCREAGNGRIVGLLPGHLKWAYQTREYQTILWRAAHWAMKREIPPFAKIK